MKLPKYKETAATFAPPRPAPATPLGFIGLAALVCCLLLAPFKVTGGASATRDATRSDNLALFDDVWQTIRDRYYDPAFHGLDWEAQREEFRPLVASARTQTELYDVLRRMIRRLRDAHTRLYAPDERSDWKRPIIVTTGVMVHEVEGAPTVVAVERGSEAERAGLRPGDRVTSVDGEPASQVFARRLGQTTVSTALATRFQAMAKLLEGPRDTFVTITFTNGNGQERAVRLRREARERPAEMRVSRAHGISIVEIDAFTPEIALDFVRALSRSPLRNARGLILDLRNNGGGEAEAMTDVASALLPAGASMGVFTDRRGRAAYELHTRAAMFHAADAIARFNGPVAILTSERTASAAEIFAATMQEKRRATIIGHPTCGCVLGVRRRHLLPDGGLLDVSEMDYRTARGTRLEGAGVTPDERVSLVLRDLRARRDTVLDHALERMKAALR